MIINFDRNPSLNTDQKLQSLAESVQMALNEVESSSASSGGGSTRPIIVSTTYSALPDKPQIEGVTLSGDKTYEDLNLLYLSNMELENMLI